MSISTNKPQIFGQASKKIPFYFQQLFCAQRQTKKSFDKIHIFSPEEFFCYAQPTRLILVSFSKSFDISLTFAFFSDTLFLNKVSLLSESYYITLLSAPQLHQTVLPHPPTTKSFGAAEPFSFRETCSQATARNSLHRTLDNFISRPDWIQRHDLAELRASLTTPLQNRAKIQQRT